MSMKYKVKFISNSKKKLLILGTLMEMSKRKN